jgi:hypothetical protein
MVLVFVTARKKQSHNFIENCNNENVDIRFSAHNAFLESSSSGDAQNRKYVGAIKPKGLNRISKIY